MASSGPSPEYQDVEEEDYDEDCAPAWVFLLLWVSSIALGLGSGALLRWLWLLATA